MTRRSSLAWIVALIVNVVPGLAVAAPILPFTSDGHLNAFTATSDVVFHTEDGSFTMNGMTTTGGRLVSAGASTSLPSFYMVYDFTNINIAAGVRITVDQNLPLILLAETTASVNGTIDLRAGQGNPGFVGSGIAAGSSGGGGGGGGGGAFGLFVGDTLTVGSSGKILASGGNGGSSDDTTKNTGRGGSGGSAVAGGGFGGDGGSLQAGGNGGRGGAGAVLKPNPNGFRFGGSGGGGGGGASGGTGAAGGGNGVNVGGTGGNGGAISGGDGGGGVNPVGMVVANGGTGGGPGGQAAGKPGDDAPGTGANGGGGGGGGSKLNDQLGANGGRGGLGGPNGGGGGGGGGGDCIPVGCTPGGLGAGAAGGGGGFPGKNGTAGTALNGKRAAGAGGGGAIALGAINGTTLFAGALLDVTGGTSDSSTGGTGFVLFLGTLGNQGGDIRGNSDSLSAGLANDNFFELAGGGGGGSGADGLPVSGPSTLWLLGLSMAGVAGWRHRPRMG